MTNSENLIRTAYTNDKKTAAISNENSSDKMNPSSEYL